MSFEPGPQQPQQQSPAPGEFAPPPPPGSGAPIPAPQPYAIVQAPLHPQASLARALGITALTCSLVGVLCGAQFLVAALGLGIAAWVIGHKAIKAIAAAPASYSGRSAAGIGRGLGIAAVIVSVLTGIAYAAVIAFIVTNGG